MYEIYHNDKLRYKSGTGVYNITNLTESDQGKYRCVTSNAIGRGQEVELNVTVIFQGMIWFVGRRNVTQLSLKQIALLCETPLRQIPLSIEEQRKESDSTFF